MWPQGLEQDRWKATTGQQTQIPNGEITRAARPWRGVAAHICWVRVVPDTGPSPLHAGSMRPRTAGDKAWMAWPLFLCSPAWSTSTAHLRPLSLPRSSGWCSGRLTPGPAPGDCPSDCSGRGDFWLEHVEILLVPALPGLAVYNLSALMLHREITLARTQNS